MQIAREYEQGGAACLSVLTDARYFQGSFDFLEGIRRAGVSCPLLCKEFIVEAYQLYKVRGLSALSGARPVSSLWCKVYQLYKVRGLSAL